jgi:phosphoribosylaminoimidazole-succinocarboxamide synthase
LGRVRPPTTHFHSVASHLLTNKRRYEKTQTIHGLPQPAGLKRCEKLPQPIFTPSTKAELGEKDENISPDEARKIVGDKYADRIEKLALDLYKAGAAYAEERGIIIVSWTFSYDASKRVPARKCKRRIPA